MKFFLALSLCFCSLTVSTHLQAATFGSIKVQPIAPSQRCGKQGYIENLQNGIVLSVSSQKCQCGKQGYIELLSSTGIVSVSKIRCR